MKKTILIIATSVAFAFSSLAQLAVTDTRGISFQAIARDNNNNVMANQPLTVTFTFLDGSTPVYEETTGAIQSDISGVFSSNIGYGTVATGKTYAHFSDINFAIQYDIQVKVSINNGAAITIGTYTLQSVPYAKYATNARHTTFADSASNGVPPGTMMAFAGPRANIPHGWLICDGTAISRTGIYKPLFDAINTTWGVGDGSTTFNIPRTSGLFLRGVADNHLEYDPDYASRVALGTGGNGNNVGTYQADQIISHTHTYSMWVWPIHTNTGIEQNQGGGAEDFAQPINQPTLPFGGQQTNPKNVAVYYIIKY